MCAGKITRKDLKAGRNVHSMRKIPPYPTVHNARRGIHTVHNVTLDWDREKITAQTRAYSQEFSTEQNVIPTHYTRTATKWKPIAEYFSRNLNVLPWSALHKNFDLKASAIWPPALVYELATDADDSFEPKNSPATPERMRSSLRRSSRKICPASCFCEE